MNRIRLALLALAVVLWTSLASAADPNIYWGGTQASQNNTVASFKGVDNTGVADSGSAQLGAWNALARSGQVAWYPAGTYLDSTQVYVGSNTSIKLGPLVTINQQLTAGAQAYPTTGWIFNVGTYRVGSAAGSLASTPTYFVDNPTISMTCTGGCLKPLVGDWMNLTAAGSSNGGNSTYLITAVSGSSSPYTVTFERPILFPFVSGDTAQEQTGSPQNITIKGLGATASGTGDQLVELARGGRFRISGLNYNTSLGVISHSGTPGAVVGYDIGTIYSTLEDAEADITGAAAPAGCFYTQSSEYTTFARLKCKGIPAGGTGIYIDDAAYTAVNDCWEYGGSSSGTGLVLGTLGSPGFNGNLNVDVKGGGAVGVGHGLKVQGGASGVHIAGWSSIGAQVNGVEVIAGSTGVFMENVAATYSANVGFYVLSEAQFKNIDASHSAGATNGAAVYVNPATTQYVSIDGLTVNNASTESTYGVLIQQGGLRLKNGRITTAKASGAGIAIAAGTAEITATTVSSSGSGGPSCFLVSAGTMALVDDTCTVTANACYGLEVASGATAIVSRGTDLSSAEPYAISLTAGGTILVEQSGVTAVNATAALTFAQSQNAEIQSSGNASGTVTITAAYYIPGMQWTFRNNNTSSSTTTFMGITVAVGKSAIIRINSAGAGERVTPDT